MAHAEDANGLIRFRVPGRLRKHKANWGIWREVGEFPHPMEPRQRAHAKAWAAGRALQATRKSRHRGPAGVSGAWLPGYDGALSRFLAPVRRSPDAGGATFSTSATLVIPATIFIAPLIRSGFMPSL